MRQVDRSHRKKRSLPILQKLRQTNTQLCAFPVIGFRMRVKMQKKKKEQKQLQPPLNREVSNMLEVEECWKGNRFDGLKMNEW